MKKTILIALLSGVLVSLLSAQGADFAPVGARWYVNQIVLDPIPADSFVIVEVTGEEMMAGQLCRVISNLSGCGLPNPAHVFTRNDSVFFYSAVTQQFELLYDFTAEVGSQWTVRGLSHLGFDVQVDVLEVTYRHFGADSLKLWRVNTTGYFWGDIIMEKVGSQWYPGPTSVDDCSAGLEERLPYSVRCYEDDSGLYNLSANNMPCDFFDDISSTRQHETISGVFGMYPNPAQGRVYFEMPPQLHHATLVVYDLTGRPAGNYDLRGQQGSIDISAIPGHLCFWQLVHEGETIQTGRLAIQR